MKWGGIMKKYRARFVSALTCGSEVLFGIGSPSHRTQGEKDLKKTTEKR